MRAFFRKYKKSNGKLSWYPIIKHGDRQYSFGGWPTKAAAEDRARVIIDTVAANASTPQEEVKILKELAAGVYDNGPGPILFGEFYNRWFNSKQDLKDSTKVSYEHTYRNYILPEFSNRYIDSITPLEVQEWVDKLVQNGLSPGTVSKCFRYFRTAMKQAEAWEMISKAPTIKINLPRVPKEEFSFLETQQMLQAIQAARIPERYLFATLGMSGLRLGEALALRWKDVDFKGCCIKVNRAWSYHGGFSEPKTPTSRRAVPLVDSLSNLLGELYHFAGRPDPEELLFSVNGETPLDPSNVRRRFDEALRLAELPEVTIHSLRHSYASLMLAKGASIKALQHALGHASATMTLNTYAHLIKEDIETATKKAELEYRIPSGKIIPFPNSGET